MFSQFIKKVKVSDISLPKKRSWFKEFVWSFYYAFVDSLVDIISFVYYFFLFAVVYHFTNSFRVSFMFLFFALIGGNQFSEKNVLKVEKKVGYKIFK